MPFRKERSYALEREGGSASRSTLRRSRREGDLRPRITSVWHIGAGCLHRFTPRHHAARRVPWLPLCRACCTRPFPHDLQRYQRRYLGELVEHSVDFVARTVASAGTRGFCDDSPWNMEIVPHLESLYPSALYLLCLRHYRGVIQSLRRSYADGRAWVGATDTDRAETWVRFYSNVAYLPDDRTLPVSFEEFCVEPAVVIGRIGDWLDQHSFDKELLDPAVFVTSHAAGRSASRPTVASLSGSGRVTFGTRPGYDPTTWTADDERAARSVVLDVDVELRARFPRHYLEPRCTTTGKPDLIQAKE
jgi:Sulfotransferase family